MKIDCGPDALEKVVKTLHRSEVGRKWTIQNYNQQTKKYHPLKY